MTEAPAPRRRYRALYLGAVGPVPAHALWAWQRAGHETLEVWTDARTGDGPWRRDRRLGWVAPQWSLSAALRHWRLPHRTIAAPSGWSDAAARIAALQPDIVLSVFFPRLLPAWLLDGLAMPVVNLHPAMLPRYRGPFPLVAMLLDEAADRCGGVTAHLMTADMDAGPIIAARPVPLPPDRNPRQWELALAQAAAGLAVDAIPRFLAGKISPRPQDEALATTARPSRRDLELDPAETAGRVDWLCRTVAWLQPITMRVGEQDIRISRLVARLGAPTGAAARVSWRAIELDLADARVRLGRRLPWDGQRLRLATLRRRIGTRPDWPEPGPASPATQAAATPGPARPAD